MTSVPARAGENAAVEQAEHITLFHDRGSAREFAERIVNAVYATIAEAVRAEERERVLGTFRALIADEKALDDESFFLYASLDDVSDFVTEVAARLARGSS